MDLETTHISSTTVPSNEHAIYLTDIETAKWFICYQTTASSIISRQHSFMHIQIIHYNDTQSFQNSLPATSRPKHSLMPLSILDRLYFASALQWKQAWYPNNLIIWKDYSTLNSMQLSHTLVHTIISVTLKSQNSAPYTHYHNPVLCRKRQKIA